MRLFKEVLVYVLGTGICYGGISLGAHMIKDMNFVDGMFAALFVSILITIAFILSFVVIYFDEEYEQENN